MSGKDFENFLYLNGISQKKAAELIGVKRQTINNWCNKSELEGNILTKAKYIIDYFSSKTAENNSISNKNGIVVNGNGNTTHATQDFRQYYSDSPDVLRAQIDILDERLKEKDAQIKEKDAQINRLLNIIVDITDHYKTAN